MSEQQAFGIKELSRFIFDKKHFSSDKMEAKPNAFVPQPKYPRELSVYETSDLREEDTWTLAQYGRLDKNVKAKASFTYADFREKSDGLLRQLEIVNNGVPHPRHCNITNFPTEKSDRHQVALSLVEISTLELYLKV